MGPNSLVVNFARCQGALLPKAGSGKAEAAAAIGTGSDDDGPTALFIDGTQISRRDIPETLANLHITDIEALEIFRGPTELPMQAVGNACGAIFIWSRFGAGPGHTGSLTLPLAGRSRATTSGRIFASCFVARRDPDRSVTREVPRERDRVR